VRVVEAPDAAPKEEASQAPGEPTSQPAVAEAPPRFHGHVVDPPEPTLEEEEIRKLGEPLWQWLHDTERFLNDHGMEDDKKRFRDNGLVRAAFDG
jgi:hypothetical protein